MSYQHPIRQVRGIYGEFMSVHPIQWQTPEPLWSRFETTPEAVDQFRPAILRFATDDFMEQILGTLSRDPAHIGSLLARPETWRTPGTSGKDMVERVTMPRIVQAAARRLNLLRPKSAVPAVESVTSIEEKKQKRDLPLKLYQPAHQRYYLVSASLVCRIAGLPDRAMTQGGSEQIGFVLRRILPPNSTNKEEAAKREFAFVKDTQGSRWQQVAVDDKDAARMVAGEELLPLFPLNYRDVLNHKRTLWTGLIPVGRREEYMGATVNRTIAPSLTEAQLQSLQASTASAATGTDITARMTQFKMEVAEPWKNLIRSAYKSADLLEEIGEETLDQRLLRVYSLNMQWQMQSWLILLDFADFLACYLPDVWAAIIDDTGVKAGSLKDKNKNQDLLYNWFDKGVTISTMPFPLEINKSSLGSLRVALKNIISARDGLESTEKLYSAGNATESDWPDFHFLLAGLASNLQVAGAFTVFTNANNADMDSIEPTLDEIEEDLPKAPKVTMDAKISTGSIEAEKLDRLTALIVRALDRQKPEIDAPDPPFALQLSKTLKETQGDVGWFVVRYVYIKRECGLLHPPTLSERTQRFQLASFFDSDAPARPIRISLPMDTTPAGIRKHSKNTAFIISDVLCGQIQRAKGLGLVDLVRSVLPWPLHKDLELGDGGACKNDNNLNIGMICSLSIPIITICALILLMIIISLLDFIFRWLPYFIICFPVPGLKGKKG